MSREDEALVLELHDLASTLRDEQYPVAADVLTGLADKTYRALDRRAAEVPPSSQPGTRLAEAQDALLVLLESWESTLDMETSLQRIPEDRRDVARAKQEGIDYRYKCAARELRHVLKKAALNGNAPDATAQEGARP